MTKKMIKFCSDLGKLCKEHNIYIKPTEIEYVDFPEPDVIRGYSYDKGKLNLIKATIVKSKDNAFVIGIEDSNRDDIK